MANPYEEKKQEREEETLRRERSNRVRRVLRRSTWWFAALAAVALIFLWVRTFFPQGPDRSQAFDIQGQDHIAIGTEHPAYNSNPPTSGWHYSEPAKSGFYDEDLPDEQLIHNLEHGEVWISYRPGMDPAAVEKLKNYVSVFVIVTQRSQNDADIALAAWGRLDKFDLENGILDEQRIEDFILRYSDKGPEKVHSIN